MPSTERIGIRVEKEEKEMIAAFAKRMRMSNSELIKKAVLLFMKINDVREGDQITLSGEEYGRLMLFLDCALEPNDEMRRSATTYRMLPSAGSDRVANDHKGI